MNVVELLKKGNAKYAEGRYEEAITYYDEVAKLDPKNADTYNYRGIAKYKLGKYEESIKDFDKAINLNPRFTHAYNNRGNSKLDKAIKFSSRVPAGYIQRNSTEVDADKYKEAIADFNMAIELNPDFAEAYSSRGDARFQLRNYKEAIKDYDRAIQLNPKLASAYNGRGLVKDNINEHESAISDYDMAIALNPMFMDAFNNRGNAKLKLEKYEDAIADYEFAIELNPFNPNYNQNKIRAQQMMDKERQIDQAVHEVEKVTLIVNHFNEELEFYKKQSKRYFILVVGLLVFMVVFICGLLYKFGVKELLISLSLVEHFNLYLWAIPVIALEALFYFIYKKADKLMHFYRHKIAVIGSLEYLLKNRDSSKPLDQYDNFKLQQYAKLYEPPSFIGKTSVMLKPDTFSIKSSEKN
ncbi:MAG: yrrB 2 [Burkholderiales bacterium]|jgi:tetratricopeptide (TPR) repeat protein|nr:yrrB 2 [Burkholderiales bacterium]